MNDDPTLTALRHRLTEVRDSLGDVHMAIPASEIFARDRRRHARHRQAAAVVAVAAVAVAVSVALPASHLMPASHPPASRPASGPGVRLAAWTVTRKADGSIQVSMFRQLRGQAELQLLQRTLRADGVPASVTFTGRQNPACQPYPSSSWGLLTRVFGGGFYRGGNPYQDKGPLTRVLPYGGGSYKDNPYKDSPQQTGVVIHPAALPSGAGVQIAVMRGIPPGPSGPWPYPKGSGHGVVGWNLVKASPQCTGS